MLRGFPFTRQLDEMDCGAACLKMVCAWHGKVLSLQYLREACQVSRMGVSMKGIAIAAEGLGFRTIAVKVRFRTLNGEAGLEQFPLPCIIHWEQRHFVVVYSIKKGVVRIADPAFDLIKLTVAQFEQSWCSDDDKGIALGLEPTPSFHNTQESSQTINNWHYLVGYVRPYNRLIIQFFIGILAGLVFQLLFPFLTQSLIDVGVQNQNLPFVWLILLAQLVLFITQTFVQFIQSWILLQIGKRVNVHLIADFLLRLMRLPLGFFDSKNVGDLMQRIGDNQRVEQFLTGSVLNIFFSVLTLITFSALLLMYDITIFVVFFCFSLLYVLWEMLFLKKRADLDYLSFQQASDNNQTLYEMIHGMQEIKLQGSEMKRRWQWLNIQAILFRIQSKSLALRQYQDFGALFFNRLKDIIISFIAAKAVIEGKITLGTLVAIQYIVAQLNAPFDQFIQFIRAAQDAKISLNRMAEITDIKPESDSNNQLILQLPEQADIVLNNISFRYNSIGGLVLQNINITIPHGKTTAIVGTSGSGKTTLLKLLLGFYPPTEGIITVGNIPLNAIDKPFWRTKCGTVMQEGFIFSDTIAANIAESDDTIRLDQLDYALRMANIADYVYGLPLSYNTKIGAKGNGLSQGQKQRLLIARAVYKNPDFLFFDEATNALDTTNERIIMDNLNTFFSSKTVVIVAHRLSTVKNADQIIVLNNGEVAEVGTHISLVKQRNLYYNLVKNQLDLETSAYA
ncbi:MAG: peptidase domain-containing ABC transporter [Saprospiraceae bacterium]|nr:peptidase domain-containing ABC transporter [Saprospiraceae bacterium]MBP7679486.1 peptidase domain-containing ABC transporter [Saprospiraceae bacterium]